MLVPPVPGQFVILMAVLGVVAQTERHEHDQQHDDNDDDSDDQVEQHDESARSGVLGTGDMRPLDTS